MTSQITLTKFGKTKKVKATLHNMVEGETPEQILWIERPEDYYAMMNVAYAAKKTAIVKREDWLRGEEI